jgi:uncharacterized membrane protein
MFPAILMVILLVLFRILGAFGLEVGSTWQNSAQFAVVLTFVFTGITHFTKMKVDFIKMIPPWMPYPVTVVFITGILEILGAVGLVIHLTHQLAGICLVLYLIAVFPANAYAARKNIPFRGRAPTVFWLRLTVQLFFIAMTVWAVI